MKLRTKLLALSLLTLLLPWSAWKLLQELEQFLRDAQEQALLGSARTMVAALPLDYQTRLLFLPDRFAPLRSLAQAPALDGYTDDWPDAGQGLLFESADGTAAVTLLAGEHDGRLYLCFDVRRAGASTEPGRLQADRMTLMVRNPRGLFSFTIEPEAPGPLQLRSEGGPGQLEGFWLDREQGYRVELVLPVPAAGSDVSFREQGLGSAETAAVGPLAGNGRPRWISLLPEWEDVSRWLARSAVDSSRAWLVDPGGWVLADSNLDRALVEQGTQQTTWLQRSLYRLVAGSHTVVPGQEWPREPVRLEGPVLAAGLKGEESSNWTQHPETAVVRNTVAVPISLQGGPAGSGVQGALVMQSTAEGLLLMTNRALGRLLLTTLALTLGLAGGLWLFATRLSGRVQRLSGAVSRAMENGADPETLPLVEDRDELGELARNNEKLLRAVADYSQYLQTLASKLSHELKTPLAITRSSLDNLSNHALDADARRFLARAQEGVDRQTAIVRAMSEASRLEAAIGAAEWEEVDLVRVLERCTEGYRAVHTERRLVVQLPNEELRHYCAPDLLAQALDKLVDNAMSLSGADDQVTLVLERSAGGFDLAVRNAGTRLPEELQERLFDSLVSVRDKRGAEPHLGLGLYIVRLVAAAHGGKVTARNLPGDHGVEFRIHLPAGND
jgi:signal transduction histidine kinase